MKKTKTTRTRVTPRQRTILRGILRNGPATPMSVSAERTLERLEAKGLLRRARRRTLGTDILGNPLEDDVWDLTDAGRREAR